MSQVLEKSPKHCADKRGFFNTTNKLILLQINKKVLYTSLFSTIVSLIFFIFLLYLILHPSNPHFSLRQADFRHFNLSSAAASAVDLYLITSTLQVSFDSRNPNQKVGIYYDQLRAYASYRGQQITAQTQLPPFYQPNKQQQQDHVNVLSATLSGYALPVAPDIVYESARKVVLSVTVTVDGRLRWKIGSWVSKGYRVQVNCLAAAAGLSTTTITTAMGSEPEFAADQQGSRCSTTVI